MAARSSPAPTQQPARPRMMIDPDALRNSLKKARGRKKKPRKMKQVTMKPVVASSSAPAAKPARSAVSVRMRKVSVAEGLAALLEAVESSGIPLSETLIGFDFDLTLKAPNPNKGKEKGAVGFVVRDGARTVPILRELVARGANIVIVTAATPGVKNWSTIYDHRVRMLGLDVFVGRDPATQQAPPPGFKTWQSATGKFQIPAWECRNVVDTPMVAGRGLILAKYDKAEALHKYIQLYGLTPRHVLFVDDFVMNAYSFALHFAAAPEVDRWTKAPKFVLPPSIARVTTMWWDPTGMPGVSTSGENSMDEMYKEARLTVEAGEFPRAMWRDENGSPAADKVAN